MGESVEKRREGEKKTRMNVRKAREERRVGRY